VSESPQQFLKLCYAMLCYDVRKCALVQVWIAYADCLTNSGELFKFLYKNEIGTGLALFWIAWAWVAEYAGDFPLADKVKRTIVISQERFQFFYTMVLQPSYGP
jgi:Mad3/BUB1 homology region 1